MKRASIESFEKAEIKRYCKGRGMKATGLLKEFYDGEDLETSVGDCIADLMHLCALRGWDFLECYERGRTHHNAELRGGEHA